MEDDDGSAAEEGSSRPTHGAANRQIREVPAARTRESRWGKSKQKLHPSGRAVAGAGTVARPKEMAGDQQDELVALKHTAEGPVETRIARKVPRLIDDDDGDDSNEDEAGGLSSAKPDRGDGESPSARKKGQKRRSRSKEHSKEHHHHHHHHRSHTMYTPPPTVLSIPLESVAPKPEPDVAVPLPPPPPVRKDGVRVVKKKGKPSGDAAAAALIANARHRLPKEVRLLLDMWPVESPKAW